MVYIGFHSSVRHCIMLGPILNHLYWCAYPSKCRLEKSDLWVVLSRNSHGRTSTTPRIAFEPHNDRIYSTQTMPRPLSSISQTVESLFEFSVCINDDHRVIRVLVSSDKPDNGGHWLSLQTKNINGWQHFYGHHPIGNGFECTGNMPCKLLAYNQHPNERE